MKRGLMKIGYFGEESSHTYACASENFPKAELIGFSSMTAAAEAVEESVLSSLLHSQGMADRHGKWVPSLADILTKRPR